MFGSKKKVREQRKAICLNCPFLDKDGTEEKTVIKGKPACSICGCNIELLTACMDCDCSLVDINREPKWKSQ